MTTKLPLHLAAGLGFILILVVTGCGSPETDTANDKSTPTGENTESDHDHAGHDHADHASHSGHGDDSAGLTDMEKMKKSLASLSLEDRDSAMKQHFCPVTDEMLGTMGPPQKVEVQGRSVWICCKGCKGKLLADPAKYIAKLQN